MTGKQFLMTATGLEPTTTYFVSEDSTRLASLAKWLSFPLRTKWLCFESRCSHLNVRCRVCFEQGVP